MSTIYRVYVGYLWTHKYEQGTLKVFVTQGTEKENGIYFYQK